VARRPNNKGSKTPSSERPATEIAAYTIEAFCAAHGYSQAMYFKMRQQGLGPDEMLIGRRRVISVEAAARWRRAREAASRAETKQATTEDD
jgi:hypothetical protein